MPAADFTFDGPTKIVTLSSGVTTMSVRDLWSRWVDWFVLSDNSKYLMALQQVGGNDIDPGAGTSIPIYAFLTNGWRLRPQAANHTLVVDDGILLVDGGGDPFLNPAGSFAVRINFQQPVQAITVSTGGGGGLTAQQVRDAMSLVGGNGLSAIDEIVSEMHQDMGLNLAEPKTITENTAGESYDESSGSNILKWVRKVAGITTITRQP